MAHKKTCIAGIMSILFVIAGEAVGAAERGKRVRDVAGDAVTAIAESNASNFCEGIKLAAQEQRYAIKSKQLNELKAEVEQRIAALEAKRSEFEKWQRKRDEFTDLAQTAVVEIYSKMRPDAAASRLEILEISLAAAILMKMSARKAGVILNEMKAERAAEVTQVLAASGDLDQRS